MSIGENFVSLIVQDFHGAEPCIGVIYEHGDRELSTVKGYEEFLAKWEEIKEFLTDKSASVSVVLIRMLNSIPWMTKEIEIEIGRLLKRYHTQLNITLRTSQFLEEEAVKLSPYFLTEVGPHVRFIHCYVTELPRLRGWFADKLELIYNKNAVFYLPGLFEMDINEIDAGKSIKLHQFFMSRFPCQPSCQSLKCHADMDIPLSEGFYENIFYEVSESLPNLKSLKLTCWLMFAYQNQLHTQTQLFTEHIAQLAKHAHIPIDVNMKVIDRDQARTKIRIETTDSYLRKLAGIDKITKLDPGTIIVTYPSARFVINFHYPYELYWIENY